MTDNASCPRCRSDIAGAIRLRGTHGTPEKIYPWRHYCLECILWYLNTFPSDYELDVQAIASIIMEA